MKKLEFSAKYADSVIFIPLGGCNEIGMNFNLYNIGQKWIAIDCGIGFAGDAIPGVEIIVPDFSFLIQNKIKVEALFLTHIHEDHVGAIAHIWAHIGKPVIYATPLGREFLTHKFHDLKKAEKPQILTIHPEMRRVNVAGFAVEFVGITHSVPEMKAIVLDTPFGKIVHTGDWKFDKAPVVGDETDFERLKQIGKEGVHSVLCDSTNIASEGFSGSEGDLEKSITKIVKEQTGRVVISTFASNLARVQTIANVARRTGRKIVMSGMSIRRITEIGLKLGYFQNCPEFLDQTEAMSIRPEQLLVICTGCQGEERAALAKIASKEHNYIKLSKGDSVIFASKIIPGNEKKIYSVFNQLIGRDIKIFTERDHFVHVSGHPNQGELKKMYSLLRPKYVIPVHGEQYHIMEHCEFVKSFGIGSIRPKNGDVIEISANGLEKIGTVHSGYLCVDGTRFESLESSIFFERKMISVAGIISCICIVNSAGKFTCQPVIDHHGVFDTHKQDDVKEFKRAIIAEISEMIAKAESVSSIKKSLEKSIQGIVARSMKTMHGKVPLINVTFHVV